MFHVKQKGGESLLFAPAPAEGAPDWRDPASSAHDAGSQFARGHMLAQALLAAQTISVCCAQHLLRRIHPNDGIVEPAVAAREAENLFFSQQMLAQARATDKHSYPLDRNVKPASFAHEAGNHFAREQMLSPAEGVPEWLVGKTCQFCTRRYQPVCQKANAHS